MKKVYVITINFNSEAETHICLASLARLNTQDIEISIIVVDNGSEKSFTLSLAEDKQGIHLIRSEKNLGFSGGNNLGMKYALSRQADYIMLINNDTEVDKNLLQEMLKTLSKNENSGLVSPKIYFAKGHEYHKERYDKKELGRVFWYAGGYADWNNVMSVHRGVDEVDKGQYDTEKEVSFATGCCMLLTREVLEEVGLFDERYFLYCEDADLDERIRRAGYKIIYSPKAIIWHISAASSGIGSALHDYYISRNRMLFGMQFAPYRAKLALLRESIKLLMLGRKWQRIGIKDFYLRKWGKGSYNA